MRSIYIIIFFLALTISKNTEAQNFNLITSLYNETNGERINEYLTCLDYNLAHPYIQHIHVIYDVSQDDSTNTILNYLKQKKVTISYITGRPSYHYCFDLANMLYPHSTVILSNADIYFNDTLASLENYDLTGKFLALTRWNITREGSLEPYRKKNSYNEYANYKNSQDVWIFTTPITGIACDDIYVGDRHCDGRIAFEANKNFIVLNPCITIQCCHLHLSPVRHYPLTRRNYEITIGVSWCTL